jgi:hypothetical protein
MPGWAELRRCLRRAKSTYASVQPRTGCGRPARARSRCRPSDSPPRGSVTANAIVPTAYRFARSDLSRLHAWGRSITTYAWPMRFFGIDSELDRRHIQALRADPPGRASSGARRSVFGASLEQWDALLQASADVVPAASPILLFYALSQAGRAVSAAHVQGQPFRSRGHGLRIGDPTGDLGAALVQPEGGPNTSFACSAEPLDHPD